MSTVLNEYMMMMMMTTDKHARSSSITRLLTRPECAENENRETLKYHV